MNLPSFDSFVAIDWSGARNSYRGIAVAKCARGKSAPELIARRGNARWTRTAIAGWLCEELNGKQITLIGFDFAFGFPFEKQAGYLGGRCNRKTVFALWKVIEDSSREEADFGCNSFASHLRYKSLFWTSGKMPAGWIARKRRTERACAETTRTRPESVYKLLGSKQVGKASITGIRVLHHIRLQRRTRVCFWPFERQAGSTIVEIYPTLFRKFATNSSAKLRSVQALNTALSAFGSDMMPRATRSLSDHETDALISAAALRSLADKPTTWTHPELTSQQVQREGWIFGVCKQGHSLPESGK